jgi:hypothetical protein
MESLSTTPVSPRLTPGRALVRWWEPVLREFPGLTASQVRVYEAHAQFPTASDAELAAKAGCSVSTVNRVRCSEQFGRVLLKLALSRGDLFHAEALNLRQDVMRRVQSRLARNPDHVPDSDEMRVIELVLKSAGLARDGAQVNVVQVSDGADVVDKIRAGINRILAVGTASDTLPVGSGEVDSSLDCDRMLENKSREPV